MDDRPGPLDACRLPADPDFSVSVNNRHEKLLLQLFDVGVKLTENIGLITGRYIQHLRNFFHPYTSCVLFLIFFLRTLL